jgi:hypothetical protein
MMTRFDARIGSYYGHDPNVCSKRGVINGVLYSMDKALILDEKVLNRIPPILTLILVLLLGSPAIALNYFGIDFGGITKDLDSSNSLGMFIIETQIRGYFIQVLLQWSAFSLAIITALLAFTQYRLTNDKVVLIIGLTILFSGSIDALHTLISNTLSSHITFKENIGTIIWSFTNTISGVIFIIGLIWLLKQEGNNILGYLPLLYLVFL